MATNSHKEVPKVLVDTGIYLATDENSSEETRMKALSMLKNAIGSAEEVAVYVKKHNVKY